MDKREYITFPYKNEILIFCGNGRSSNDTTKCKALTYDPELDMVSQSPSIFLEIGDRFQKVNQMTEFQGAMYIFGNLNMYSF